MRFHATILGFLLVIGLIACGGEEAGTDTDTAEDTSAMMEGEVETGGGAMGGEMSTPAWMTIDESARTATLEITAGESDANNRWNYNGLYAGNGSITVPQGYEVTINFDNADPTQPHSLGIGESMGTWPATFDNPQPVFAGAMTPDPATTATPPDGNATITFTTDTAGDYSMICYVPGHAVAGMVVPFTVSGDGSYGVTR